MARRPVGLALSFGLALWLGWSGAVLAQALDTGRFAAFLAGVRPAALAQGVTAETFDAAVAGLTPDPSLVGFGSRQSEFSQPLSAYLANAASAGRASTGATLARRYASELAAIEARSGVPREIVVAIWGLETDFGRQKGSRDLLRSLATAAFLKPDGGAAAEFILALRILQSGVVSRASLQGSWAGATGHPQFLPSAYFKYAVRFAGNGPPDIWTSIPDALASIANYLHASGWTRGQPWGAEVRIPGGFDYPALRAAASAWQTWGFAATAGALPASGEVSLFVPAGAGGPAFLLGPNFFVLKAFNFSDSYAMAAAILADRIAGRGGVQAAWPADPHPLTVAERSRIQSGLMAAGFYRGTVDGRFGPVTRDAVWAFQRARGLRPADGFPSRAVLEALDAGR